MINPDQSLDFITKTNIRKNKELDILANSNPDTLPSQTGLQIEKPSSVVSERSAKRMRMIDATQVTKTSIGNKAVSNN